MKTNTITKAAAPALLLIAWLLFPQTAHCFYNPSTGRWISRDSIAERGGKNLFAFAGNSGINRIDLLGKLGTDFPATSVPDPNHPGQFIWTAQGQVVIPKCTILILAGHTRGMPGTLKPEDPDTSYGEVYGCATGGGEIESGGVIYTITPLNTPGIPGAPSKPTDEIDGNELLDLVSRAFQAAKVAANDICKKKKCACGHITIETEGHFHSDGDDAKDADVKRVIDAIDNGDFDADIKCK